MDAQVPEAFDRGLIGGTVHVGEMEGRIGQREVSMAAIARVERLLVHVLERLLQGREGLRRTAARSLGGSPGLDHHPELERSG
nr:hypothetical protein [Geminicoccus roseus]